MQVNPLALINFLVQIGLVIALFYAGYLAGKGNLKKHCTTMRIVVPVQIAAMAFIMVPSLIGYGTAQILPLWLFIEMLVHGALGLTILGIWVYVNLVQSGVITIKGRLQPTMRTAFIIWMIAFIIGVHVFIVLGTGQ